MAGKFARKIYRTAQWAHVRRAVLERDAWKCRQCGRRGRLEVHHIASLAAGGAAYDLDNCRALCRGCHFAQHREENRLRGVSPDRAEWIRYMSDAA